MKQIFYLLIATFLLLIACKKNNEKPEPPTQYMPQELKDYMLFKTGSYWVYQNLASGAIDSVVVVSDTTYIHKEYDHDINAYATINEKYIVSIFSFADNRTHLYETVLKCLTPNVNPQDFCYSIKRRLKDLATYNDMGLTTSFFYQPILGRAVHGGFYTVSVGHIYDSLQVGNMDYHYVTRMDHSANTTEGGWPTRFYFAKHHGIIRKDIIKTQGTEVWNLVRSDLIQ